MNTKTAIENTYRMRDSQSHTHKNAIWGTIAFPKAIRNTNIGKENQIPSSEIKLTGKFPVIDQGQPFIAGYSDENDRVIRNDLPLVIFGDHTRVVKFVDFPFILGGDGTKVLKPCEDLFDDRFFYYVLKNLNIPSRGYNRHFTLLKERRLPKPELPEQRKIAAVLGIVQRAIEQQERLLALTAELKKTLLHQLFTRGLRNEPQKQTEIGIIPQSWNLVRLCDFFETQLGKMLSQKARVGDDPKPYLRNKNIQWGTIDTNDLLRMDFNERERAKFTLISGDLLVCEGGEPGRSAIWRGELSECFYQKALHRLRPKSKAITNIFLAHWMEFSFRFQNLYGIAGASSTIAHLPEVQLKCLTIPLPDRDEQDDMCKVLDGVDEKIKIHRRKHAALSDLFSTLLHELMTANIRVDGINFDEHTKSYIESGESNVFPQ